MNEQLNSGRCLWEIFGPPAPRTAPLNDSIKTDVAIVGAGYTGLSTALHLAEAGIDVVVLEAETIGFGGSGRNAGHCTPLFQHISLDGLTKRMGEPWAERMISMQTEAGNLVFGLIDKYALRCDANKSGFLHVAHAPSALKSIEVRCSEYAARGRRTRMIDRAEAERLTGSPSFFGGWIFEEAGNINPLAYARGLAKAAMSQGARIHTQTPATKICRSGNAWHIETPTGHVQTDRVVMATGAYERNLWPGLRNAFYGARVACMASRPLSPSQLERILPEKHHVLDTCGDFTNFRLDRDGRLVTSLFVEGRRGGNVEATKRMMTKRFQRLFPTIENLTWEYYWFGNVDLHPETFPQLIDLGPGIVAVVGYSSRGVPTATAIGKQVSDLCTGTSTNDLAVKLTPLAKIPPGFGLAVRALLPYYRARDAMNSLFSS